MLSLRAAIRGVSETIRQVFWSPGFPAVMSFNQEEAEDFDGPLLGENPVRFFGPQNPGGSPISALRFVSNQPAAAGESVEITVEITRVGGTTDTILTGSFTFGGVDGQAAGVVSLLDLVIPGTKLFPGDLIIVDWGYTAGDAPTMAGSGLFLDYYGDPQP